MGSRNRPGAFDCAAVAFDDEETFTLLARSEESPDAVTAWASHRQFLLTAAAAAGQHVSQADHDQVAEAFECANRMRAWRRENLYRWRNQPRRDRWAIVEIMGHRRHCGRIREIEQFGIRMLLVEVPTREAGVFIAYQYSGPAIFCISPSDEATCRGEEFAEIEPASTGVDGGGVDGVLYQAETPRRHTSADLTIGAGFFADDCALDACPHEMDCVGAGKCQRPRRQSPDLCNGLA